MKLFLSFLKAPQAVKLEIQPNVLAALMANGQLHATDFRCLDLGSKQIVWKMLLSLAKSKLTTAGNLYKPENDTESVS
ncbi:MAG: hypothetical protein CTY19_11075 [Methylomonas sp.]|nr:MAG: hypothetical protein CTY19_11075 [Methylomonas sp.]